MRVCQGCGGIVGRDCFNPEECLWITQQQANQTQSYYRSEQETQHSLRLLMAEIASICDEHDESVSRGLIGNECSALFTKLRQLSSI